RHYDVDATKLDYRCVEQMLYVRKPGDVRADRNCPSARASHLVEQLDRIGFAVEIVQNQRRSGPCEHSSGSRAYSSRRSSDDCDLVLQLKHRFSSIDQAHGCLIASCTFALTKLRSVENSGDASRSSAGNGGHDRHLRTVPNWGVKVLQKADVFALYEKIDESSKLTAVLAYPGSENGLARIQSFDQFSDGARLHFDNLSVGGQFSKRRGNNYLQRHK